MPFDVQRTTVHGRPLLSVRGELDLSTAPLLADAAEAAVAEDPAALVVDLTGTTFLDSSGARQLLRLTRLAAARGVALEILCPPENRPVWLVVDLLELRAAVPIVEAPGRVEGETGP